MAVFITAKCCTMLIFFIHIMNKMVVINFIEEINSFMVVFSCLPSLQAGKAVIIIFIYLFVYMM